MASMLPRRFGKRLKPNGHDVMSWQLRALNFQLRCVAKPRIGKTSEPSDAARAVKRACKLAFQPPYLTYLERQGDLAFISAGPFAMRQVILYFHGGGFISGSPKTHQAMIGRLAGLSGREICAPFYPLLPEGVFPAAPYAALAAWNRLRALGYRPQDIVLGGDSAGGNLCLGLLSHLCEIGQAPAGAFAFSPWTDLTLSGDSLRSNAERDVLLPPARIGELTEMYLADADPKDPRASPLLGDYPNCPPVWISYSKSEILRDDSTRMVQRLRDFGSVVETEILPNAPHVWQIFQGWLPEGTESLKTTARFIQACFEVGNR